MKPQARLGVVLVNWNGWQDTIECLESLLGSTLPLRIAVVDNASADGSLAQLADWAAGRLVASAAEAAMAGFSSPPAPKPLELVTIDAAAARSAPPTAAPLTAAPLTAIEAGANLGFAGGNNVGLAYLLRDPAIDYVWLLNNDTVVEATAAAALLAQLDATFNAGMCGTVVRYYHRPGTLQCLNGSRFGPWTGVTTGIAVNQPASTPYDPAAVAQATDMVLGASLAVSRRFVERVGPMAEDYFLYFEELDWAYRNRGRFTTSFARGAVVYHKEGGSIGSSSAKGARSAKAEYWLLRSRLKFVRRYLPLMLPWHWLLALALIMRRLLRRQPSKARAMLQALFGQGFTP